MTDPNSLQFYNGSTRPFSVSSASDSIREAQKSSYDKAVELSMLRRDPIAQRAYDAVARVLAGDDEKAKEKWKGSTAGQIMETITGAMVNSPLLSKLTGGTSLDTYSGFKTGFMASGSIGMRQVLDGVQSKGHIAGEGFMNSEVSRLMTQNSQKYFQSESGGDKLYRTGGVNTADRASITGLMGMMGAFSDTTDLGTVHKFSSREELQKARKSAKGDYAKELAKLDNDTTDFSKGQVVTELNEGTARKINDQVSAGSKALKALKDIFGDASWGELAQMAQELTGVDITTVSGAKQITERVNRAKDFARSNGLSEAAVIREQVALKDMAQRSGFSAQTASSAAETAQKQGQSAFDNQRRNNAMGIEGRQWTRNEMMGVAMQDTVQIAKEDSTIPLLLAGMQQDQLMSTHKKEVLTSMLRSSDKVQALMTDEAREELQEQRKVAFKDNLKEASSIKDKKKREATVKRIIEDNIFDEKRIETARTITGEEAISLKGTEAYNTLDLDRGKDMTERELKAERRSNTRDAARLFAETGGMSLDELHDKYGSVEDAAKILNTSSSKILMGMAKRRAMSRAGNQLDIKAERGKYDERYGLEEGAAGKVMNNIALDLSGDSVSNILKDLEKNDGKGIDAIIDQAEGLSDEKKAEIKENLAKVSAAGGGGSDGAKHVSKLIKALKSDQMNDVQSAALVSKESETEQRRDMLSSSIGRKYLGAESASGFIEQFKQGFLNGNSVTDIQAAGYIEASGGKEGSVVKLGKRNEDGGIDTTAKDIKGTFDKYRERLAGLGIGSAEELSEKMKSGKGLLDVAEAIGKDGAVMLTDKDDVVSMLERKDLDKAKGTLGEISRKGAYADLLTRNGDKDAAKKKAENRTESQLSKEFDEQSDKVIQNAIDDSQDGKNKGIVNLLKLSSINQSQAKGAVSEFIKNKQLELAGIELTGDKDKDKDAKSRMESIKTDIEAAQGLMNKMGTPTPESTFMENVLNGMKDIVSAIGDIGG